MVEAWHLPVDLRWLASFAVLAEELHFTRAAERLSVSQPALSQQIARLETQVGVRLFTRAPGAVELTPAGEALWRDARPAMSRLRAGIDAARAVAAGVAGTVRVRHLSSYGPVVLPKVAASLREVAPGLRVELREASIEEQIGALRERTADVGVFHLDPDVEFDPVDVVAVAVARAPRYVALPRGHPLAARSAVGLAELAGEVWIMPMGASTRSTQEANFVAACRRSDFEPRIGQRANSIETILGLVASGFGVAPAPWSVALRDSLPVHLVRVADDLHAVIVAHRRDAATVPAVEQFVTAARRVVNALLADIER